MPSVTVAPRTRDGRVVCTLVFNDGERIAGEEKALRSLGGRVKMDGFRPGNAPLEILRERINPEDVFGEIVRVLVSEQMPSIVKDHSLTPIARPSVEATSRNPLSLTVTFVVRPDVKVKGAAKITIEKKEIKITNDDVERIVQEMLTDLRTTKPVDRAAKAGDALVVDLHATDKDGKEMAGSRTHQQVTLGNQSLLPEVDAALTGAKAGDEKTAKITLPAEHPNPELHNASATLHMHVDRVEEVTIPPLTDEVSKTRFGMDAAALRTTVEQSMKSEREGAEHARREKLLLDAIRDATSVEIAPELLRSETDGMIEELMDRLTQEKKSIEEWLKASGRTPEEWRKDLEKRAKDRIQLRLGIEHLVEEKKITVPPADVATRVEDMIARTPEEQKAQAKSHFAPNTAGHAQLTWQMTVEKLLSEMLGE
jgi:trigger factor